MAAFGPGAKVNVAGVPAQEAKKPTTATPEQTLADNGKGGSMIKMGEMTVVFAGIAPSKFKHAEPGYSCTTGTSAVHLPKGGFGFTP